MINRPAAIEAVSRAFGVHPAVVISGPRQCGKTTLARLIANREAVSTIFDLERAADRRALEQPEQSLSELEGLIVIDEIQRKPELFEILRVLLDRPTAQTRFLLLGSASPDLVRGVSESLAGRVGLVDLGGFILDETGREAWKQLWLRGGFPRSFLATNDSASALWRENFIRTFLERDIPQLGITLPAETLRRFWTMIAHYHGQVWNASEFARALGTSQPTARRYLDILIGTYMVRTLPPWFENLKKRQVKSPKVFIRDSGILHGLLELETMGHVRKHPKLGASWEGFALEQVLASVGTRSAYFWATHAGAELDLLITKGGRRFGFEFKHSDAPGSTKSMQISVRDLHLSHLWVVFPGEDVYQLADQISTLPIKQVPDISALMASFTGDN